MPPEEKPAPQAAPSDVETVTAPVANPIPGEVVLKAPKKPRPAHLPPAAPPKPKCWSAFHDRPLVALEATKRKAKPGEKQSAIDAAPAGPFETKALPAEYFHKGGGACPCAHPESPEFTSEAQRLKQIVRIARRDPRSWVPQDGPTE